MKNFTENKAIMKKYEKPSANVFYYSHQPLNVLFVSQGQGQGTVDGGSWGDMHDNDNNN